MEQNKNDEQPPLFATGTSVSDQPSWLSSLSRQLREFRRELTEQRQNPPVYRNPAEIQEIWGKRRYKAQALSFAGYAALIGVVSVFPTRSVKGSPSAETVVHLALNRPMETFIVQPPALKPPDHAGADGSSAVDGTGAPKVRRPEVAPPARPANNPGGGGGGGKLDPTPASGGPLPQFGPVQIAVPMPVPINKNPELAIAPTLVADNARPPDLNLFMPKMGNPLGDPAAPPSSGGGNGGGLGEGRGRGIGDDPSGGVGFGPGCCKATGDGAGDSIPNEAGTIPGDGGPGGRRGSNLRGSITEPVVIVKTKPAYSEYARKNKVQGTVILEVLIREDGAVDGGNIRIVKSQGYGLDESAMSDIKAWKFKPATQDGRPIPRTVRIEVNFALR